MNGGEAFGLDLLDYLALGAFAPTLSTIGYWAGWRERGSLDEYFLAGRRLP